MFLEIIKSVVVLLMTPGLIQGVILAYS